MFPLCSVDELHTLIKTTKQLMHLSSERMIIVHRKDVLIYCNWPPTEIRSRCGQRPDSEDARIKGACGSERFHVRQVVCSDRNVFRVHLHLALTCAFPFLAHVSGLGCYVCNRILGSLRNARDNLATNYWKMGKEVENNEQVCRAQQNIVPMQTIR